MQKGIASSYILIGLVILIFAGGVIYTGKFSEFLPASLIKTAPVSQIKNNISDWKTYTDSQGVFALKYPNSWISTDTGIINTDTPLEESKGKLFRKGVISIKLSSTKDLNGLEKWFNKTLTEYKSFEGDPPYTNYKSKETITFLDKYQALKILAQGYGQLNYVDYFVIDKAGSTGVNISISYPDDELNEQKALIDQILSTFEFLPVSSTEPDQKNSETTLSVETLVYKPNSAWLTYTDNKAKFSVQYGSRGKINSSEEGKSVVFLSCGDSSGKEVCLSGFSIRVFDNYKGGSRREWLLKENPSLKSYDLSFEEVIVSGVKTLIVFADDPASNSGTSVLMPKNNKMYLLTYPAGKKARDEVKRVLSTFKFL